MDELWARAALIAASLAAVVMIALIRRRAARGVRTVEARRLAPGVYLFSSTGCATCERARGRLDRAIGDDGYAELTWEDEPETFADVGVDVVPAVLVVDANGARLFPGQPDRALRWISR